MKLTNVYLRLVCCACGEQKKVAGDPYDAAIGVDYATEKSAFQDGWRAVAAFTNTKQGMLIFRCGRAECQAAPIPREWHGRELEPYTAPERWWLRNFANNSLGVRFVGLSDTRETQTSTAAPIPMLLHCPFCGKRHIDRGEFATRPHHTHACQECGMVWRPALVPTVGVQYLPGYKDLVGE